MVVSSNGQRTNALIDAGNRQTVTKGLIQKTSVLDAAVHRQHNERQKRMERKSWVEKCQLDLINNARQTAR